MVGRWSTRGEARTAGVAMLAIALILSACSGGDGSIEEDGVGDGPPAPWAKVGELVDANPTGIATWQGTTVIVGTNLGGDLAIWASDDPGVWSQAPTATFQVASFLPQIASTADGFLLIDAGQAWRSIDGTNWAEVETFLPEGSVVFDTFALGDEIGFVGVVESETTLWLPSDEGYKPVDGFGSVHEVVVADAARGSTGFVAVGTLNGAEGRKSALAWHSVDGEQWTSVDLTPVDLAGRSQAMTSVAWVEPAGRFVASAATIDVPPLEEIMTEEEAPAQIPGEAVLMTSVDGKSWERIDEPLFGREPAATTPHAVVGDIDVDEGIVVVGRDSSGIELYVEQRTLVWSSVDGDMWRRTELEAGWIQPEVGVSLADDVCVAVSSGEVDLERGISSGNVAYVWAGECVGT